MEPQIKRFWEIDCLRGVAVLLMLVFHLLYDLVFFGLAELNLHSAPLLYLGRCSAFLFILISGIALSLSYTRTVHNSSKKPDFRKYLQRGFKLFSLGLAITGITRIFFEEQYIVFGILHFFGVSAVLAYPFLRLKAKNLILGFFFIIIGLYLQNLRFGFFILLWLGFQPYNFQTLDYFPIFPWFGVFLIGLYLGGVFYPDGKRKHPVPHFAETGSLKLLSTVGKHSLFVYFLHQPLFLSLLFISGFLDPTIL